MGKKFFIVLFGFFSVLMLFIFVIRISKGQSGFFGLSDLFAYFDSGAIDLKAPIDKLVSDLNTVNKTFNPILTKLINNFGYFTAIIMPILATIELIKVISFIVVLFWDLFVMFFQYIQIFGGFINYITSFPGYVPVS